MGVGSVEGCDDQESICSSNEREREGDAFPKAFERELVTPTNLQKIQNDSLDSAAGGAAAEALSKTEIDTKETNKITTNECECFAKNQCSTSDSLTIERFPVSSTSTKTDEKTIDKAEDPIIKELRSLEERRRSLLDHHWAVPKKER